MTILDINVPTSWGELSDAKLKLVFRLFARELSAPEVKTICLLRWNKMKIVAKSDKDGEYWVKFKKHLFTITAREIYNLTSPLNFLDEVPPYPVRYLRIGKALPLAADFEGVPFEKYIYADNIFQGYLHTEKMELLKELLLILYDTDKIKATDDMCIMAFYWFASLKQLNSQSFPHFYQPIGEMQDNNLLGGKSLHKQLMDAVNAQIRALTGGDVTKEPYILKMDTIRALTELDCKAWEAEQLRKQK